MSNTACKNPVYLWCGALLEAARRIPEASRNALVFQAFAHNAPAPEVITLGQRTAAGIALDRLHGLCGLHKRAYNLEGDETVVDRDRVCLEGLGLMSWNPDTQLWHRVVDQIHRTPYGRDRITLILTGAVLASDIPHGVSDSEDPDHPPFYKRTLESFADETITCARPSRDGQRWYAVIDVGPQGRVSDPDFSNCAATETEARRRCAARIRADAKGIGKYSPHSLLKPGYDLHFRLMKHWAEKETQCEAA